jgi:Uncharacterized conserved protein
VNEDMILTEGGCLCGAVRYSFSGPPLLTAICHCTHCQRQSGSAFSVVAAVLKEGFSQQGEGKLYMDKGESGNPVERHFCGDCGSPLYSLSDTLPEMVLIKAGTLDDSSTLNPQIEVYCASAMPFTRLLESTEKFQKSNL